MVCVGDGCPFPVVFAAALGNTSKRFLLSASTSYQCESNQQDDKKLKAAISQISQRHTLAIVTGLKSFLMLLVGFHGNLHIFMYSEKLFCKLEIDYRTQNIQFILF